MSSNLTIQLRKKNCTELGLVCMKDTVLAHSYCDLVWFYGISTIVGYLMPNPLYTYILDIYDLSLTIQLNISHLFTLC